MGEHHCLYYDSLEDLCLVAASFFRDGIKRNEFCLWIIPESLSIEDAQAALEKDLGDLNKYLAAGQLEIRRPCEWYTVEGAFDPDRVLKAWGQKEREVLAKGFRGIRAVGDASWCSLEDREKLTSYEASAADMLPKANIFALCAYPTDKFGADEVRSVRAYHEATLSNLQGKLTIFN